MSEPAAHHKREPSGLQIGAHALIGAGLVAMVFAAFFPALSADFLRYDDQYLLTDNLNFRGFRPDNIRWMFTSTMLGHYQPLTWLSYALDYSVAGMNPKVFHLTNILLHAVNAVLVYVLSLRLLSLGVRPLSRPSNTANVSGPDARSTQTNTSIAVTCAAVFTTAFFALHPLRVESVAWATERRDVLSAAFLLGAAIVYLRAVRHGRPGLHSVPMYIACIGLLTLSLLSKAWGMSFFVLMLILDWYPLGRIRRGSWLRDALALIAEKTPMIVLGFVAAVVAGHAQNDALAAKTIEQWGIAERLVQACYGLVFYVRTTVWPFGLSPLYVLPKHVDPLEPRYLGAYVVIFAGVLASIALVRRVPALLACALVYGVCVAPVLGFFQSGDQFVADRYSYLACIPWAVLIAAAGLALSQRARDKTTTPALIGIAALVMIGLSVVTFMQAQHWKDTESLWRRGVAVEPSGMTWTNLALELDFQNRTEEAVKAYVEAVKIDETDGRAWYAMGNALRELGHPMQAEAAFQQAAIHMPQRFMALVNLGSMYMKELDNPEKAVIVCREAVIDIEKGGRRPLSAMPYLALGNALRATKDFAGARAAYTKALEFEETKRFAEQELKTLDEMINK